MKGSLIINSSAYDRNDIVKQRNIRSIKIGIERMEDD